MLIRLLILKALYGHCELVALKHTAEGFTTGLAQTDQHTSKDSPKDLYMIKIVS